MNLRRFYIPGLFLVALLLLILSLFYNFNGDSSPARDYVSIEGFTQGTTFTITYEDIESRDFSDEISVLFSDFDRALSSWVPDSEISKFNAGEDLVYTSPYFYPVLLKSKEVFDNTNGAFDPTIAPIVNAYGFGPEGRLSLPDSIMIDSLIKLVNFDYIIFDTIGVKRLVENVQLDFNGIAQGYSVDVIANFLKEKGLLNFYVEIGGEVYAQGVNMKGKPWQIGIVNPSEDPELQRDLKLIVRLQNKALVTSGNYLAYYEEDGVKYAHTISPISGRPVQHTLLSATVLAPDAITADAYATAFMVLGLEASKKLLAQNADLEAIFIYSGESQTFQTYYTEGIRKDVIKKNN